MENEDPKKTEEIPKNEKVDNRGKTGWTEDRKQKQRLRMTKIIAEGRAYKGKNKNNDEYDEVIESNDVSNDVSNDASNDVSNDASHNVSYYLTYIALILIAIIAAVIFFLKTGTMKGGNND